MLGLEAHQRSKSAIENEEQYGDITQESNVLVLRFTSLADASSSARRVAARRPFSSSTTPSRPPPPPGADRRGAESNQS